MNGTSRHGADHPAHTPGIVAVAPCYRRRRPPLGAPARRRLVSLLSLIHIFMVYSEDLARLAEVDGSLYLIRPGSRLNISVEEGLADVADALNKIITPSMKTCVLLDTMAGEGTQVGTSFELSLIHI